MTALATSKRIVSVTFFRPAEACIVDASQDDDAELSG